LIFFTLVGALVVVLDAYSMLSMAYVLPIRLWLHLHGTLEGVISEKKVNYLLDFVFEVFFFLNLVISEKKVTSGFSYKEEHSVLL
jgi:hypothetical protein